MRISGSNYPYNSVVSTFHKYPMRLISGTEYAVRFQLAGIKKDKQHITLLKTIKEFDYYKKINVIVK